MSRGDLSAVDVESPVIAVVRVADIDHQPSIFERPGLSGMKVAAEVDARHDSVECVEEAPLTPVPPPGDDIGESHRAAVGQQRIDPVPGEGAGEDTDVLISDIPGLSM